MTSTDSKGSSPDKKDDKSKFGKAEDSHHSRDSDRDRRRSGHEVISRDTNKNDSHSLRCRVFIGNLPSDKVSRQELEDMFKQYGEVIGCSVHTNFGFVQFGNEKDADLAVSKEHGKVLYGKKVDVNLAGERRKPLRGEKRPADFEREDRGRERRSPPRTARSVDGYPPPPPPRFGHPEERFRRGGSPPREDPYLSRDPRADPYADRRADPYERYDRYRHSPERDPYYRSPYHDQPPLRRDPYYDRPDDRPPPREGRGLYDERAPPLRDDRYPREDRYREGYPYRGDDYGQSNRDYYGDNDTKRVKADEDYDKESYQKPGAPIDCEIIVVNKQQRGYADLVERRLKGLGLITLTHFLTEPKVISEALDDVARRGILYAIVITSQHEVHRSVTVNILHGTAQEHRNMPLEDAMSLVGKNFDAYMQDLRERSASSSTPKSTPPAFSAEIKQLLTTASTGKDLTVDQLTQLISALQNRKDEMMAKDSVSDKKDRGPVESTKPPEDSASIAKQQAELQAKIFSILNPGAPATSTVSTSTPTGANMKTSPLPSAIKKSPQSTSTAQSPYPASAVRPQSSPYNSGFVKPTAPAPRTGPSPTASPASNQYPLQQSPSQGYSTQSYGQHTSPVTYPGSGGYSRVGGIGGSPAYGNVTNAATTLSNNPSVQQALDKLMQSGLPHAIGNSPQSRPVMPPGFPPYQR